MKKLKYFLILISIIFVQNGVLADVMPAYTTSISKNTIGFIQVPKSFNVYLQPSSDSVIVDSVTWNNNEVKYLRTSLEPKELFTVQKTANGFAYCMVVDEYDGWYKIIYNKVNNSTGWIKPDSPEDFWSLREFVSFYGRKYGMYYMKNVHNYMKVLHSGANKESQTLGGFTMIKNIKLVKVSGNWALVTVVDFDNKPKIGYIRWREDDGSIIVFPKMQI